MSAEPSNFPRTLAPTRSLREILLEPEDVRRIRDRLAAVPLFLLVPRRMQRAYRQYRFRDLSRYLRIGAPLLALLIIGLSLLQTEFFDDELSPRDARLWVLGTAAVCVLLVGTAAAVQLAPIRRWYELVASVVGSIVLLKLALVPQFLADPEATRIESYFCMLTVFIVTVALRLRLVIAAATVLGSGILACLALAIFATQPDFRALAFYYGSAMSLGLFVAWQLDEKEKTAFLQAVLIEHETREREAMHEKLLRLARHDALTDLANRRELERRLALEWDRLRRDGRPLAVVFADIDHFKSFNDTYGHSAGDECLAKVAATLRGCLLRPADFAARYGGEEFVLVLPDTDAAGAADVARRALEAVDALDIPHAGGELGRVTLSLGVSVEIPGPGGSPDRLLDRADQALYAAKHGGRHALVTSPACPLT